MAAQFAALLRMFASAEGGAALKAGESMELVNMIQSAKAMGGGGGGGNSGPRMQSNLTGEFGGRPGSKMMGDIKGFANTFAKDMKTMIFNPIKGTADLWTDMAKALTNMPGIVRSWGEELKSSQQHLRLYSGVHAQALGMSRARDIARDMRTASRTGDSFTDMTESLDELKDTIRPYQDEVLVALNNIASIAMQTVTSGIKTLEKINKMLGFTKVITSAVEWIAGYFQWKKEEEERDNRNFFQRFADGIGNEVQGKEPLVPKVDAEDGPAAAPVRKRRRKGKALIIN